MTDIQIIVLAAGKGRRMRSNVPKAMMPLAGSSLVEHLLDTILELSFARKPIVVIAPDNQNIKGLVGDSCVYATQEKQLGTGHAVATAREKAKGAKSVIVLYADQPFIKKETLYKLTEVQENSGCAIAMATVAVLDFEDWRKCFFNFSRVVRDASGKIARTVEKRDATEEDLKIMEVNPAYFCFDAQWLWENLPLLKNQNAQEEYYLTDLVGMAIREGRNVETIPIDPKEALGANSQDELALLESIHKVL